MKEATTNCQCRIQAANITLTIIIKEGYICQWIGQVHTGVISGEEYTQHIIVLHKLVILNSDIHSQLVPSQWSEQQVELFSVGADNCIKKII